MRVFLLMLALLTAPPAWAGPGAKRLLSVMGGPTYAYVTTINGISSISQSGVTDTGVQTFTMTANPITAVASCSSSAAGIQSGVDLVVDGTVRDSIACDNSSTSKTLSYTPTAGSRTVDIIGGSDDPGIATFSAGPFRIPGVAGGLSILSYFNADSATTAQALTTGTGTVTTGASVTTATAAVGANALTSTVGNSGGRISYNASGNIDQTIGTLGMWIKVDSTPTAFAYLLGTATSTAPVFNIRYISASSAFRFAYRGLTSYIDMPISSFPVGSYVFMEIAWNSGGNVMAYRIGGGAWTEIANATGAVPAGSTIQFLNMDANASNCTVDNIIISAGYKDDLYSVRNSTSF